MTYFLLVYDQKAGRVLEEEEFKETDRAAALRARFAREAVYSNDPNVEIVVLAAESREALARTHARYFKSPRELLAR